MSDILIVDDEEDIRELISGILIDEDYEARTAHDAESALMEIAKRKPSLILLDIWLQGSRMDGLEILVEVKKTMSDLPVVIISGHGNIEVAVTAMQAGAYDFIEKPLKVDHLLMVVERALESAKLKREITELKLKVGQSTEFVGVSQHACHLRHTIDKVAPTGSRVLITGPAGAGKETMARLLHGRSHRAQGPFVGINTTSLSPDQMEAELFGIEKTDTTARKIGVIEQAHGGTLFLDEIAEMPLETQGKILRILISQSFLRVGGSKPVKVDVRVISSTRKNLAREIEDGNFREDLYHRLNVVPIDIPALAERRDDIPDLVRYFVEVLSQSVGLVPRIIKEDAMATLQTFDWPGNVRQLRNVVEQILILCDGDASEPISAESLPAEVRNAAPDLLRGEGEEQLMTLPLREAREIFERRYLRTQITRFNKNISKTAIFIGMERSALHRKLKSLGITSEIRHPEKAEA